MIPSQINSLLVAIDFFLATSKAHYSLANVSRNFGDGYTIERWGAYARVWEALFQSVIEAVLFVCHALRNMSADMRIENAQLRDAMGSAFGSCERLEIVVRNYRCALAAHNAAKERFLADRSTANYQAREAADNSRGTWYRELHLSLTRCEKALEKLASMRSDLIAAGR